LWNNSLRKLDEPSLQAIFSPLAQVEEITLDSQEKLSKLESIFPNLKGKFKIV